MPVEALRRQRYTGKQIARELGISPATVSRILRRRGLNRLSALEPAEPIRRYAREKAGELIHLDIKKLGRIGSVGHRITGWQSGVVNRHQGIGWEFVHVCIDDASRVAFVQVMADQRKRSVVVLLQAAVAYYAKLGVRIERVMTDNGSCYRSKTFRAACTIGDRAYLQPDRMGELLDAGADIVVRAGWKNARWLGPEGKPIDLLAVLRKGTTAWAD